MPRKNFRAETIERENTENLEKHFKKDRKSSYSKVITFTLPSGTHSSFRMFSFSRKISMSNILRFFITRLISGDQRLHAMLNQFSFDEINRFGKDLSKMEIEDIYNFLDDVEKKMEKQREKEGENENV